MTALTGPQLRALAILASPRKGPFVTPREVAERMWPDSPGWAQRSRRHATAAGGALGATMPMKGATMLWKLRDRGLAHLTDTNLWQITEEGKIVLAQTRRLAGEGA